MPSSSCTTDRSCIWRIAARNGSSPFNYCVAIKSDGEPCGASATLSIGGDDWRPGQPFCTKHASAIAQDVVHRAAANGETMGLLIPDVVAKAEAEREREEARKAKQPGFVYFARRGEQVKIGFTRNPDTRIRALETQSGFDFDEVVVTKGTYRQEQKLHDKFSDHRQTGEWFTLTPEIRSMMDQLAA